MKRNLPSCMKQRSGSRALRMNSQNFQRADALGAKYNNIKKLMYTMLSAEQLIKDDKGRYFPTESYRTNPGNPSNSGNPGNSGNPSNPPGGGNQSGNPQISLTCGESEAAVTTVTGVTEDNEYPSVPF
jgi:hypothetical protein